MQHDAADELHAEGLHAQHAPCGLPYGGECLRQQGIEILAAVIAIFKLLCFRLELLVCQSLHLRLERLYLIHYGVYLFKLMVCVTAEQFAEKTHVYRLSIVFIYKDNFTECILTQNYE